MGTENDAKRLLYKSLSSSLLLGSILNLESILQICESKEQVFPFDWCLLLAMKFAPKT